MYEVSGGIAGIMTGGAENAIWQTALEAMSAPVGIVEWSGQNTRLIFANDPMRQIAGSTDKPLEKWLAALEPTAQGHFHPIPGQPGWHLQSTELESGKVWLWQASRRPATKSHQLVADWVSAATMGDMGLFFLDPEGKLRAFNAGVHHYFPPRDGFPIIGADFESQLDAILDRYEFKQIGEHRALWRRELLEVYENPGTPTLGVTPAGRWALATATRMGDGSTFVFMNDITEFRERDQQIKLFMRNAMSILFSRRWTDGTDKIHFWGKARETQFGSLKQSDGTWRASDIYDNFDPRDLTDYLVKVNATIREGKPYVTEYRFYNPVLREIRWIREHGWLIRDQDGVKYLDAMSFDITETKMASEQLSESEERFRQFTEMASDWYFETSPDYQLTFLSEKLESVTGYPNSELMKRSYDDLISLRGKVLEPHEAEAWQDYYALWKKREPFKDVILNVRHRDGSLKTVSMSGEPQYDADGVFKGMRGIGHDLTALTKAQNEAMESLRQAEEANASKSSFIANVSHELRTPLNAILGFSAIMSEEVLGPMGSERYRSYAEDIQTSGQHLLSLVNDLLDVSRLEAGRMTLDEEELNLSDEIGHVHQLMASQVGDREIRIDLPCEDILIEADQRAIRQVMINLYSNAVKFSGENTPIQITSTLADDGAIAVTVTDQGVGIPEEELEQIFEPFGRAKSEIAAEGTGLGLPLSRNLMQLHGGDLVIESTPGEGTSAIMLIPASRRIANDGKLVATG